VIRAWCADIFGPPVMAWCADIFGPPVMAWFADIFSPSVVHRIESCSLATKYQAEALLNGSHKSIKMSF